MTRDQIEIIKKLYKYYPETGILVRLKNGRVCFPDNECRVALYDSVLLPKMIRIKYIKLAWLLSRDEPLGYDYRLIQKDKNPNNFQARNLVKIHKLTYLELKGAIRNLNGELKVTSDAYDRYNSVVRYYNYKTKQYHKEVFQDSAMAKVRYNELRLKYSKLVNTYYITS